MDESAAQSAAEAWITALQNDPDLCSWCWEKTGDEIRTEMQTRLDLSSTPSASDVGLMRDYATANRQSDLDALHATYPSMVNGCFDNGSAP